MSIDYYDIPTIDVGVLRSARSLEDLKMLADRIKTVYSNIGFAYLVNHGISSHQFEAIFEQSRLFHQLPEEEKLKIKQNPFYRGYMPFAASQLRVSTLGGAVKPNQSAAFILGHDVDPMDPDYQAGINLAGPNQWPSETLLPHFKQTLLHYRDEVIALIKNLVRVIALSFGQHYYALDQYFVNPTTFLRLQYYPKQPEVIPEHQYGIAPHTDYGFLTVLAQDGVGGLQVKSNEGSWIDVPPLENALVLNTGDMLRRMSNDTFLSTPHRVINISGKARYSIPFFFEPNVHAHIKPMLSNTIDKYQPMEYAGYLMERVKGNYSIGAR